jgi:hypothetical protein
VSEKKRKVKVRTLGYEETSEGSVVSLRRFGERGSKVIHADLVRKLHPVFTRHVRWLHNRKNICDE